MDRFTKNYQQAYKNGCITCKHCDYINCTVEAECRQCGWNPKVTALRKRKLEIEYRDYFKMFKAPSRANGGA